MQNRTVRIVVAAVGVLIIVGGVYDIVHGTKKKATPPATTPSGLTQAQYAAAADAKCATLQPQAENSFNTYLRELQGGNTAAAQAELRVFVTDAERLLDGLRAIPLPRTGAAAAQQIINLYNQELSNLSNALPGTEVYQTGINDETTLRNLATAFGLRTCGVV